MALIVKHKDKDIWTIVPKTSDQENHQIIDFLAPTQYRYCQIVNIPKYSELLDLKLL